MELSGCARLDVASPVPGSVTVGHLLPHSELRNGSADPAAPTAGRRWQLSRWGPRRGCGHREVPRLRRSVAGLKRANTCECSVQS